MTVPTIASSQTGARFKAAPTGARWRGVSVPWGLVGSILALGALCLMAARQLGGAGLLGGELGGVAALALAFAGVILALASGWRQSAEWAAMRTLGTREEQFRLTFENANAGIAHLGLDGSMIRVNRRFCEMFGYSTKEFADMPRLGLTHPEDQAKIAADFQDLKSGRISRYAGERRYIAKNGDIVPVWTTASLVHSADDAFSFVMIVVEDQTARKAAEAALRESEERFRLAMKGANEGLWDWRLDTGRSYLSPRWKAMLGYEEHEIADTPDSWEPLLAPGTKDILDAKIAELETGRVDTYEVEIQLRHKDGHWVDILSRAFPVLDENRKMVRLVGTHQDITERKRQLAELRKAAAVFNSTHEGIVITDSAGRVEMVNPAFEAITGYPKEEVLGRHVYSRDNGRHGAEFYKATLADIEKTGHWQGEVWNRRKDGTAFPEWLTISAVRDPDGRIANFVGLFSDIGRIKQSEARLAFLAHHDSLTSLPNRLKLREAIEETIAANQANGADSALLFLDLDRFKTVNDSLGHAFGDQLLIKASERWRSRLGPSDMLARLGGDEFVILLSAVKDADAAALLANQLVADMTAPFLLEGEREVYVGLSIGITLFGKTDEGADMLIQQADSALYAAKEGGGGVRFYSPHQTRQARERLDLEAGLRRALDRGEFALQYQPLIELAERRAFGAEALVRWRSPSGLIAPNQFIPLAEKTGLIIPLGDWVLREACARMKRWLDAGLGLRIMAVNLSPRQFDRADVCDRIQAILEETGLPPQHLEIEITETALMEQGRNATRKLDALKALGVKIAVDDFGTGHSSLAYLKRFRIDKLKLDRSFIIDIPADPTSMEIAAAVIRLGQSLGLEVLAEGVETEAQADFLTLAGCPSAQGYLFAKPMWEEDLLRSLDRGEPELPRMAG